MAKDKTGKQKRSFWNMHLTTIFSMSLVLFLIGLVCTLFFAAKDMTTHIRENVSMSIVLEDSIPKPYVDRIEKYLSASLFARSTQYISKQDALQDHIESLGENPEEFLGYNPLKASIELKLKAAYANSDSVRMIESKLKTFEYINRIAYQKDVVDLVNDNVKKVSIVLLGIAVVLLFISIALINSTVRLMIYSNRFLINTMKLVGAKAWFIRRPYIARGILNGFIASLLAIIYLGGLLYYFYNRYNIELTFLQPITLGTIAGVVILLGILLSALSSFFAVGRYLRMKTNDMYFI